MTPRLINEVEMIVCVQRSEKGDSKTMNKSVIKRVICQTRRAGDGEGGGSLVVNCGDVGLGWFGSLGDGRRRFLFRSTAL